MMELVQDLFILFWCSFVPDVSFGNGWFASSDWPANKRERDGIFDPFLGVRNIICFAPGKLCFPLREIDFVTENSLPARGWKTPPKSSFFTGATVARPEIWPAKDFRAPFARKQGRSGHFGVEKWRFIARIRLQDSPFSVDFRRLKMQNLDHSEPGLVPVFGEIPAQTTVYCGKQRTGLRPNSSPQRTSSELGRPSVRSA